MQTGVIIGAKSKTMANKRCCHETAYVFNTRKIGIDARNINLINNVTLLLIIRNKRELHNAVLLELGLDCRSTVFG